MKLLTKQQSLLKNPKFQITNVSEVEKYLNSVDIIGVDTETQGLDPHQDNLLLITFGDLENQFAIDTRTIDYSFFYKHLENPNLIKVFQNFKFDYKFFWKNKPKSIKDFNSCKDTYIRESLLNAGRIDRSSKSDEAPNIGYAKVNLYWVVLKYLGIKLDKQQRNSFIGKKGDLTEEEIIYACKDIQYLTKIYFEQQKEIEKLNMELICSIEEEAAKGYGDLELNGIYLNKDYWINTVITEYEKRSSQTLIELDEEILKKSKLIKNLEKYICVQNDLFGTSSRKTLINYDSPKVIADILKSFGANIIDSKTKKETTNAAMLESLEKDIPFAAILNKKRKIEKILSTYGHSLLKNINKTTNRIHPQFFQLGTDTGRVSCTEPNLQNIPKEQLFRSGFQAQRKGFKILGIDYASAELRIMADAANDPEFIRACDLEDPHAYIASIMYGRTITKKSDPEIRNRQKTINFGLAYGASVFKFAQDFNCSLKETEKILNKFFECFPATKRFFEESGNFGTSNGYSLTLPPFNRIRWYPEWEEMKEMLENDPKNKFARRTFGEIERAAKNHRIQGACGDVVKLATVKIRKWILDNNYSDKIYLVNQVHDEFVFEVEENFAEYANKKIIEIMKECGKTILKEVVMDAVGEIDDVWKK